MTLSARAERIWLGIFLLIFICFTAHGLSMFYSGDDMMNMYQAWILNPWTLGKAQLFIWMPVYRPLGGAIYRIFYAVFGFHNLPLYILCWLMLAANVLLSFFFFKAMGATAVQALLALSLTLVHGSFQDLYLSAGTIYDRLWFLFTALGLVLYARVRNKTPGRPGIRASALICVLCILSMDSKESGVALPVLLACYEALFILPDAWRNKRVRAWLRGIVPLFCVLALLSVIFVVGRVQRTQSLTASGAYRPHAGLTVWLSRVADYFSVLTYGHVLFSMAAAGTLIFLMALAAMLLRNRVMFFGWLFFVITITPVALISVRPGYVLYVPDLGLGLYVAASVGLLVRRHPKAEMAVLVAVTIALMAFHIRNWPGPFHPDDSPEKRLTEQFRRDYPTMPAGSKLLFVSDDFSRPAFDLFFNLRLMYHDRTMLVHRMVAPPDQQPNPAHPVSYDHVFVQDNGRYLELDNHNIAESVRLRILRNYAAGREMDFSRRDYVAYPVSGVMDGDGEGRWITPRAKFKFDLYPAPAVFTAKFWVPDFIVTPVLRTISILVNGVPVGSLPLTHAGLNEIRLPVAAAQITRNGFTIVDINIDKPYRNAAGLEFGVVLMRAGFEYKD